MKSEILTPMDARLRLGLRREDIASASGLSYGSIVNYELKAKWPKSLAIRRAYLKALNLTEAAVCGDEVAQA